MAVQVADLAEQLRRQLSPDRVITDPTRLWPYECDGTGCWVVPSLVTLPESTEEVALVVVACARAGLPYVALGAVSGLSVEALPFAGDAIISLVRTRKVLGRDIQVAPLSRVGGKNEVEWLVGIALGRACRQDALRVVVRSRSFAARDQGAVPWLY